MTQCPKCRSVYVTNTIFCAECGVYLPEVKELRTEPFDADLIPWGRDSHSIHEADTAPLDPETRSIRLRISNCPTESTNGADSQRRELEIALVRPIRLGRLDPVEGVYPEIDLTEDAAKERGVSREHARIFRHGDAVEVEDLGSTNGTLLNGALLPPYRPVSLQDGDQLQLGSLMIEVSFGVHRP